MIQEVIANAYCAFARLASRGKANIAFATPLANYAIRQVIAGRRVGTKMSFSDVTSPVAQRHRGFTVKTLPPNSSGEDIWSEILIDDTLTPVPDQVAFRIDFSVWLKLHNTRKQELVSFLAVGNTATEAAQRFCVSIPRISQLRGELQGSWQAFQGDAPHETADTECDVANHVGST